ncbi:PREDICTED: auxin-responsive protein SAUR64-like [Nelumbo nucifera]|uniref:Auxin-responsive protein SAUR64-like n=1 Tax=Nelumbo nucifera TaxID=4432 RepID=A0A1U7YRL1_NELNU|nr:PREDICTED: auxin-responsive protein SAUR64-like [Nelumbo nucifera]
MINHKKLVAMARKWQKLAAIGRRRISSARATSHRRSDEEKKCSELVADKGHFVVYTADNRRFVIPLAYLSNPIFIELLRISEEEFGLPNDGPITLPCDAVLAEYIISLVQRRPSRDLEKALLMSLATCRCPPSSSLHQQPNPPLLVN